MFSSEHLSPAIWRHVHVLMIADSLQKECASSVHILPSQMQALTREYRALVATNCGSLTVFSSLAIVTSGRPIGRQTQHLIVMKDYRQSVRLSGIMLSLFFIFSQKHTGLSALVRQRNYCGASLLHVQGTIRILGLSVNSIPLKLSVFWSDSSYQDK